VINKSHFNKKVQDSHAHTINTHLKSITTHKTL